MVQHMLRASCVAASLLALAGCSDAPPTPPAPAQLPEVGQAERIRIEGSLFYLQRIALPDNAQAVVELREGPRGPLAVEQRIELRGRQVPVQFGIELDRQLLKPATDYVLQAAIQVNGEVRWVAEPVAVELAGALVQLGEIRLDPQAPATTTSEFLCGELRIAVTPLGEDLQVSAGDERFLMRPVVSASGARYALPDDPSTSFWSKGENALLEIRGQAWPECVPAAMPGVAAAATDPIPGRPRKRQAGNGARGLARASMARNPAGGPRCSSLPSSPEPASCGSWRSPAWPCWSAASLRSGPPAG